MKDKIYVQYGCGLSAPGQWLNFDASPTLRLQKTAILGKVLKRQLNVVFPENVLFGDIVKGLPIAENSCSGIYCSHVLEHLALEDLRIALRNTYKLLKPGGVFRCVLPDLEILARDYLNSLDNSDTSGSIHFMEATLLGIKIRPKGLKAILGSFWGNSHHLWMWDHDSLTQELTKAGFVCIRPCFFNDAADPAFKLVEDEGRFYKAVAIEALRN